MIVDMNSYPEEKYLVNLDKSMFSLVTGRCKVISFKD